MKRFLIMIKLFLKTSGIVIPFSILVACCNVFLFKLTTGFIANVSNPLAISDAIYYFGDINLLCFLLFLFWIFISFEFMRKAKEMHMEELLDAYGRSGKLVYLEQVCVLVFAAALLAINISVYYIVACFSLSVSDLLTGEAIRLLVVNVWCLSFGAIGIGCVLAKIKKRFWGYVTMLAVLFLILPNTIDFIGMLQRDYHIPVFFFRDLICLIPPDMSAVNDTLYGFPTETYRMAAMGFWVVFALLLFTWEFYKNFPKRRFIFIAVLVGLSGLLLYQAEVKGSVLLMKDHPEASLNEIVDYYIKHEAKDEAANFKITEYNINMTMGKELEAEVIMDLRSPEGMSCYRFTLYHGYKIKEVTDGAGAPLEYSREGDYLEVQSQGDRLSEICIAYKGHSSSFYANKKACFLPGFFPYYPRAGYRMIYDINKRKYVSHRDEKAKFHVTVDKDHMFSNLRKEGKTFEGVAENLILVNGYYKETKSEGKRMITYPLSEGEEQGIKERLKQLPTELEELQSFLGIPDLETSFPELIVTVPGSLAMASSVQKYFSYEDYALVTSDTGAYDMLEEKMLESGIVTKEKKLLFDTFFSMHIEADTDVDILGLWKEEEGFTGYETKEMELSDFFVEKIRKYGAQYVSSEIMRYLLDENNHMDSLEFIKRLEKGE